MEYKIREVLKELNIHPDGIYGNGTGLFSRPSSIWNSLGGSITFCTEKVDREVVNKSKASVILTDSYTDVGNKITVLVSNPKEAFVKILEHCFPTEIDLFKNHASATINDCVTIGKNVIIYPGCVIGYEGEGHIANDDNNELVRFPHYGGVVIEDDVEIFANTVIVRGAIDNTIIGKGTKIGNLSNIGHNVTIGENCMITAGVIIGGSTKIGKWVYIGINATIRDNITIGNHATIGMGAVVTKDVPDNDTVVGNPATRLTDMNKKEVLNKMKDVIR